MSRQAVIRKFILAKYGLKQMACVFLGGVTPSFAVLSTLDDSTIAHTEVICSYVYEFNFHDPLMQQKAIRQAVKTMIFPNEISRGLGEPLHFVLPKSLYEQEWSLFLGSAEQYLESLPDIHYPLQITLKYSPEKMNEIVANRLIRNLSQSDLFRVRASQNSHYFQLAQANYCTDDPYQLLSRFHSQSPDNHIGYVNARIDGWLDALNQSHSSVEQDEKLIHKIVRQLETDIVVLPLFQYQRKMRHHSQ